MNFAPVNTFFSHIVAFVAMIVVAYIGSLFIWQIINQQDAVINTFIHPTTTQGDEVVDKGVLFSSYPLFGTSPVIQKTKKRVRTVKKRKVTAVAPKVSLKLRGILSGVESFAIIEIAREQGVYAKGESVSYLYIEKIAKDYVIFSDNGIEHKVYVSDENVTIGAGQNSEHSHQSSSQDNASQQNTPAVDNNALPTFTPNLSFEEKQTFQKFKKSIRKNPLQMIGKVNAYPYRENGKLVGYQVTPGSERALFKKVGLRAGDIILSANGKALDQVGDFTEGMRFMEQLGKSNQLDLLINRRGIEQRIYVTID